MVKPIPYNAGASSAPMSTVSQQITTAVDESSGTATSMQPAYDEPHSNLPFDPRMARQQFWAGAKNVTAGVISSDTRAIGIPLQDYNLAGVSVAPFYCFFMFNPAEIDTMYSFDTSDAAMLPLNLVNPQAGNGGGVLTQSVSFNLLFDRTYEVWNGPRDLPPSASYGFAQGEVTMPKNGGPYKYGCLWDVWALERLCGIFRQVDGVPPESPPLRTVLHVSTGGVDVANALAGAGVGHAGAANQSTVIQIDPSPASIDLWGWITSLNVQYTRFDSNMVPTRCAVALSFQLTYASKSPTPNPGANAPGPTTPPTTP